MNQSRRRFVGQCATVAGTSAVSAMIGRAAEAAQTQPPLLNWAGNYRYSTNRMTSATSLAQVQEFVRKHDRFKVLGTRHCFNGIADSTDASPLGSRHDEVVELDRAARKVTVESGISYGQLCPQLDQQGFALHNLASLPHISVAGACATGTHGSGVTNGNLVVGRVRARDCHGWRRRSVDSRATLIPRLFQRRRGQSWCAGRRHQGHAGCAAGVRDAAGRVSGPADGASQRAFRRHRHAGYSVSLFTDWQRGRVNEVWVKRRVETVRR